MENEIVDLGTVDWVYPPDGGGGGVPAPPPQSTTWPNGGTPPPPDWEPPRFVAERDPSLYPDYNPSDEMRAKAEIVGHVAASLDLLAMMPGVSQSDQNALEAASEFLGQVEEALITGALISEEDLEQGLTAAYQIILDHGSDKLIGAVIGVIAGALASPFDGPCPLLDIALFATGYVAGMAISSNTEGVAAALADATLGGGAGLAYLNGTMQNIYHWQQNNSWYGQALSTIWTGHEISLGFENFQRTDPYTGEPQEPNIVGGAPQYSYDGTTLWVNLEKHTGGVQVDLAAGTYTASSVAGTITGNYAHIKGSSGADFLYGDDDSNTILGGVGNDLIDGRGGNDIASYSGATVGVTVDLSVVGSQVTGEGTDTLVSIEGVIGTSYADTLSGNSGSNILDGSLGNDSLYGAAGDDILMPGRGTDLVDGGAGNDTVSYSETAMGAQINLTTGQAVTYLFSGGPAQTDTLVSVENAVGGTGNDTITGSAGANVLVGLNGYDRLYGLDGDDELRGSQGNDTLDGGAGSDTAVFSDSGYQINIDLDLSTAQAGDGLDTLVSIENIYGSAFNDEIRGSASANLLAGNFGNDFLYGRAGDDRLIGGYGHDRFEGGAGNDTMEGGEDVDTVSYAAAAASVDARLNTGAATRDGDGGADVLVGIENLEGSAYGDTLVGDASANWISGGLGADVLLGLAGDDFLIGGAGTANQLQGGAGNDVYVISANDTIVELTSEGTDRVETDLSSHTLRENVENLTYTGAVSFTGSGNASANVIVGGVASDVLLGMAGDDRLVGGSGAANQLQGGTGNDTYVVSANDTIIELAGEGTDKVETTLNTYVLRDQLENLTFIGTGDFVGTGNSAANVIAGGLGNDRLKGGGGNDTISGGPGSDVGVLSGIRSEYLIENLGGGYWRVTDTVAGRDGVDFVSGIEQLAFSSGANVVLDPAAFPQALVQTGTMSDLFSGYGFVYDGGQPEAIHPALNPADVLV